MAGQFDQRHEGQGRIISNRIANKEVALMQMWVKSTHWLLLTREIILAKHLINRKGNIGIFWSLHVYALRKAPSRKGYGHKHNLISKIRGAKCFKSVNEIKGHRKCMVILKFLENIEGAVVPHCP